jgi:hypothetical protein
VLTPTLLTDSRCNCSPLYAISYRSRGHAGGDFLAVDQLVVDLKRVFGIDEEVVEVQDALAKPLQAEARASQLSFRYTLIQKSSLERQPCSQSTYLARFFRFSSH